MKKMAVLLLAMLLVVSLSVAAYAEPCTHPHQVLERTDRVMIACNADGHVFTVTQVLTCTDCWETFERYIGTENQAHRYAPYCIADYGHNGKTHSWLMGYGCCSYTFIRIDPCVGPPCPTTP